MKVTLSPRRRLGTFRLGEETAHQIQSGFWNIYEPSVGSLQGEFAKIWDGAGGDFAACDRLFFAFTPTSPGAWGHHGVGTPPASPEWWNSADQTRRVNAWREANTWVGRAPDPPEPTSYGPETCALSEVKAINAAASPKRTMRAVISRSLFGLRWGPPNFTQDQLKAYVRRICMRLQAGTAVGDDDLRNACMGWNLMDDTFDNAVSPISGITKWQDVIGAVHTEQKAHGLNLPFFFNWNMDQDMFWKNLRQTTGQLWKTYGSPPPTKIYYDYIIPDHVRQGIAKESDGNGAFPDDAKRVLMPYSYPWGSGRWDYTVRPPWLICKQAIESLSAAFADNDLNKDLQIHPTLPSGQPWGDDTQMPAAHADMHKQIRVALELEPKRRITGIWFVGWRHNPDVGGVGVENFAKFHWVSTSMYREEYAEAIQYEIGDLVNPVALERLTLAKPGAGAISEITNLSSDINNPTTFDTGIRIEYQLITRTRWRIEIEDTETPATGTTGKWVIDEGFGGGSPAGIYDRNGDTNVGATNALRYHGTSAYWAGLVDTTDINDTAIPLALPHTYSVTLVDLDGGALGATMYVKKN